MAADDAVRFDLADPLPQGKLAIQASAGTGKTYTLADLATRFIADGRASASELLIVTFTRAATDELRSRVRDRVVGAVEHLAHGHPAPEGDALLTLLSEQGDSDQLARLQRAVSEFDAATVTTIHGFAKQVLGALGVSAGADPDARLDADSSALIRDTCADVLIAAAVEGGPSDGLPGLDALFEATMLADGRPDLALVPSPGQPGAAPSHLLLRQLVERSVALVSLRRRQQGTLSFDDVLTQLRDALCGPGGESAVASLRSRFRVALIDEFQDTDPVQWQIFSTLFDQPDTGTSLVLVGDPKQAIYAFRGADVHTYLRAVQDGPSTSRRSLLTNWRSDDAVLTSLNALFDGATFGSPDIPFVPVGEAEVNRGRYLQGGDGQPLPALSVRLAIGDDILRHKNNDDLVITTAATRAIYADLVTEVARLLDEGPLPDTTEGERPSTGGTAGHRRAGRDALRGRRRPGRPGRGGDPGRGGPRWQRAGVAGRRPHALAPPRPQPSGRPPPGADVRPVVVRRSRRRRGGLAVGGGHGGHAGAAAPVVRDARHPLGGRHLRPDLVGERSGAPGAGRR